MVEEDECLSRFSKRLRQKKNPQRGPGVATLEKIRLEEQRKVSSSSSNPLPDLNVSYLSSSLYEPQLPVCVYDKFNPPPPPPQPPPPLYIDSCYNPTLITSLMQEKKQTQHSSMVNNSSSPSATWLDFQMEPPSIQCYEMWDEEEKMVASKSLWPYSSDNPPELVPTVCSFDKSSSCSNDGGFSFGRENGSLRGGSSNLASTIVERKERSTDKFPQKGTREEPFAFPAPDRQEFLKYNLFPEIPVYNEEQWFGSSALVDQHQLVDDCFLQNENQSENSALESNNGRSKVGADIDLTLRL